MPTTNYDRPIQATLVVRLANGEEWDATPEDLTKFGLVSPRDAYMAFRTHLIDVLARHHLIGDHDNARRDLTDCEINPLRYFVETILNFPDLLDHPDHQNWDIVADLERRLRATPADQADPETA